MADCFTFTPAFSPSTPSPLSCLMMAPCDKERWRKKKRRTRSLGTVALAIWNVGLLSWQMPKLCFFPIGPENSPFPSPPPSPTLYCFLTQAVNFWLTFSLQLPLDSCPNSIHRGAVTGVIFLPYDSYLATFQAIASGFGKYYTSFAHQILYRLATPLASTIFSLQS